MLGRKQTDSFVVEDYDGKHTNSEPDVRLTMISASLSEFMRQRSNSGSEV